MIALRGYQQDMIDRLRYELSRHRRVLLQAPTGAGKTALAVHMMSNAAARGKSSMFLVHQTELLKQTSAALWQQKLAHGMICPGRTPSKLPAQVAMVQTLSRRLDRQAPPDLIIIDEAHRSLSKTYSDIIEAYPNAHVVGLTATPRRTDGKGLDEIYGSIVLGPELAWMIKHGYLCDYRLIAPDVGVDVKGVKQKGGDWDATALEDRLNKPTITGNAIAEYQRYAPGKRCVTMCVNINHARAVAEEYTAQGVPAACIEGEMSATEREDVLTRFRAGELKVITNVQLLVEGVDIPSIEVVQWLRPTQSVIIWMQGNGRGFRPAAGKEALIILDHVANWKRHGMPDEAQEWSLEPAKKRKAKSSQREEDVQPINTAQCPACFAVFFRGPTECPACKTTLPAAQIKLPEQVEGALVEISREEAKRIKRIERGIARSIPDLVAVGVKQGYKHPAEWAAQLYARRLKRPPTREDFDEAKRVHAQIKAGVFIVEDGII